MDAKHVGEQIVTARKKLNLTQKELASQLNVSDKTISKWERGVGCPDISLLLPLCELLHIEVSELLGKKVEVNDEVISKNEEEQKLHQFIDYAKLKTIENKNKLMKAAIVLLCVLSVIAMMICFIVDFVMNQQFTYSVVVMASILYGDSIIITFMGSNHYRIEKTLAIISLLLCPFLYVLSWQPYLSDYYPVTYIIGCASIVFAWLLYGICFHLRINYYFRFALMVFLSLLLNVLIAVISNSSEYPISSVICSASVSVVLFIMGVIKQLRIPLIKKTHQ